MTVGSFFSGVGSWLSKAGDTIGGTAKNVVNQVYDDTVGTAVKAVRSWIHLPDKGLDIVDHTANNVITSGEKLGSTVVTSAEHLGSNLGKNAENLGTNVANSIEKTVGDVTGVFSSPGFLVLAGGAALLGYMFLSNNNSSSKSRK